MITVFFKKCRSSLYKKTYYSALIYILLRISEFHSINIRWKQSHTAIHRKKQNIEKQKRLKEERSSKICSSTIGFPTEFTRSILYPHHFFSSEAISGINQANFFFSDTELNKLFKLSKEASLRRVGLSSSVINKSCLEELKKKASEYIEIDENTENIEALLEILSKNGKIKEFFDLEKEKNEESIIVKLVSICKTQKIFEQEKKKEDVMRRLMDLKNSNSKAIQLLNITMAIQKFRQHELDTGSPEVQAAVFTVRIHYINFHLSFHYKDKNSLKSLRHLVHKRQAILKYLRRKDYDRYFSCIKKLGLTDNAVLNEITI
ncbi:ribosomal protein S15 [Pneumocystis murina B123]|uniref:Ribosomal protein S15 n=1 Tax=Pneumocystis murina (strain B123) TaxID=1069680 RepID=M7NU68_PNEMU|nr:ribosomal protein S15 [Pneumocystis murina B123]EMR10661.1 ribosomal protein S15 [Pneumocystis murina B123]